MASAKAGVRFTANFEANLAQIEAFWNEREAPQAYASLLADLGGIVGNLERHPRLGRRFFARSAGSIEVRERVAKFLKRAGATEVREYLSGDYLLLYCIVPDGAAGKASLTVHLLAIKHHRQLSFDFESFWQANRGNEG
jgi:hypothetical protein